MDLFKNIKKVIIIIFFIITSVCCTNAMDYTVGTGDVLIISVYEHKDLTSKVRVSGAGNIEVPLIGKVQIKGLTLTQISRKLTRLYEDGYIVKPQITIIIEEYGSKKAVILGQIVHPGLYELRENTTFLELISKAGGLSKNAGKKAILKRKNNNNNIPRNIIKIDLERLIKKGETSLNIQIQNGDSIYIAEAEIDNFYVTGEVKRPSVYNLEKDTTVIKAITLAGGFTGKASPSRITIIRQVDGKEKEISSVKMDRKILKDDIIVVPESFF